MGGNQSLTIGGKRHTSDAARTWRGVPVAHRRIGAQIPLLQFPGGITEHDGISIGRKSCYEHRCTGQIDILFDGPRS